MQSMVFALLVAFLAVLAMGPFVIEKLRRLNFGATERNYGLETHNKKTGTPIMGGIMILAALAVAALVFSPAQTRWSLMLPAVLFALGFGGIGFLDDFIKAVRKRPEGLSAKQKITLQVLLSLAAALFCYFSPYVGSKIYIPFTDIQWDLGIWYIPFAVFTIVATTNSVNLMDGVDGLLSTVTMIVMVALGLVALFAQSAGVDAQAAGAMSVLCAATAGPACGLFAVQRLPGARVHGGYGVFRPGRGVCDGLAPAPAAAAHPRDGRDVRGGEPFGHPADPLHQVPAPAAPAHGPAAPSL